MSSSPTSSSSSDRAPAGPLDLIRDVLCQVQVELGSGSLTVGRVLGLQRQSIVRLDQSAGEDLMLTVNGVRIARGEVMIVEDSTAVRITEVHTPGPDEA